MNVIPRSLRIGDFLDDLESEFKKSLGKPLKMHYVEGGIAAEVNTTSVAIYEFENGKIMAGTEYRIPKIEVEVYNDNLYMYNVADYEWDMFEEAVNALTDMFE